MAHSDDKQYPVRPGDEPRPSLTRRMLPQENLGRGNDSPRPGRSDVAFRDDQPGGPWRPGDESLSRRSPFQLTPNGATRPGRNSENEA